MEQVFAIQAVICQYLLKIMILTEKNRSLRSLSGHEFLQKEKIDHCWINPLYNQRVKFKLHKIYVKCTFFSQYVSRINITKSKMEQVFVIQTEYSIDSYINQVTQVIFWPGLFIERKKRKITAVYIPSTQSRLTFSSAKFIYSKMYFPLKVPKHEIFVAGIFTQIIPVWVGDLGTMPKNSKSLWLVPYIHFLS